MVMGANERRGAAVTGSVARPRRVGVAEAKARLSEVLREAAGAPVVIQSRGRDVAVLMDPETYARLGGDGASLTGGGAFLAALAVVRERFGPGVDEFDPAPSVIRPVDPFGRRRR
jgi:prevent-host-death family protein